MADWLICFRVITVYAGSDVSAYQERHGAIIQRRQVVQWLDASLPEDELLGIQPAHTFFIQEILKGQSRANRQRKLVPLWEVGARLIAEKWPERLMKLIGRATVSRTLRSG